MAIDGTEITLCRGPFIPDAHAIVVQVPGIGFTFQKPQQFMNDGTQMTFLGGDEGKTFCQVKAHLVAKHAGGAGAGAVALEDAVIPHMPH